MTAPMRAPIAEALGALAGVFRTPNLRRLELAYAASLAGMWGYGTAAAVYIFGVGGAALVGVSAAIRLVPAALAAPFAAVLADRHSRRGRRASLRPSPVSTAQDEALKVVGLPE